MFEKRTASVQSLLARLGGEERGFLSGLLGSGLSLASREQVEFSGVLSDAPDGALLFKLVDQGAGDGPVDLELLHEGRAGDNQDLGDLTGYLREALLVEEDLVVELVLDLDLGPGLLLGLASFSRSGLLGGLRALGGASTSVFTTLLLLGLNKSESPPRGCKLTIRNPFIIIMLPSLAT